MKQNYSSFKLVCLVVIMGLLAAVGSALHSTNGLETQIVSSSVAHP